MDPLHITILGTGTSQGVPVIGCDCKVCLSNNPKDKRRRVSILLEKGNTKVLIDCGPDFRAQMLDQRVTHLDAVILSHEHTDHMIGMDDLRPLMFRAKKPMPIYALKRVISDIEKRFAYAFEPSPYPGVPRFEMNEIGYFDTLKIADLEIKLLKVMHGKLPIVGFRIGDFAYLTDVKTIPKESLEQLKGLKVLLLSALHEYDHHAHLTLQEAIDYSKDIGADTTFFTHMSHYMGLHDEVNGRLPSDINLAYDGQILKL